jgi:2-octaprenyl-6-methoxyphenol hydroxylase
LTKSNCSPRLDSEQTGHRNVQTSSAHFVMRSRHILVIGAGPVGATFALLACAQGATVHAIDARPAQTDPLKRETRTLALSHGSFNVLSRAGLAAHNAIWQVPHAAEIHRIHTSQAGSFGRVMLTREDASVPALGYVLRYADLQDGLDGLIAEAARDNSRLRVSFGARVTAIDADKGECKYLLDGVAQSAEADLIVLADGGANLDKLPQIAVHEKDYGQSAMLAHISLDRPHHNVAYERFTSTGPLALLPSAGEIDPTPNAASAAVATSLSRHMSAVWVNSHGAIDELMAQDDEAACAAFQLAFDSRGTRVGRFVSMSERRRYPLRLRQAATRTLGRLAIIGNAAQAMHPVAGQGFNLGLRDAEVLAQCLASDSVAQALAEYQRERAADVGRGVAFTDLLASSFMGDALPLRVGRGLALAAVDLLPFARRALAKRMLFGARG